MVDSADLEEICRLCLANKIHDKFKIFFAITDDQKEKFETITDFELPLIENLPSNICSECSDQLENFYFYKNQLVRKQNELLQFLKMSINDQFEELSPQPDSNDEEPTFVAEIDEDQFEIDGSDYELEAMAADSENTEECDVEDSSTLDTNFALESEEIHGTVVLRSDDIEYVDEHPKLVLTSNYLKAKEALKQSTNKDPDTPATYLAATLITNTEEKSVYICNHCKIEFSSEPEAKMHMNDHRFKYGSRQCEYCQMNFKTQHNYEKHLDAVHNNTKFVCQVCGKVLDSRNQYRSHLRNHDQTLKYSCTYEGCAKAFRVKHHLKNHLRVHTKDSPFVCSFGGCSARFRQKHALTIHYRKHNGDYFTCDSCKSPFVTQFQLNKHLKTCNGTFKPLVTRTPRSEKAPKQSKDVQCSIDDCHESFKSMVFLEMHLARSHLIQAKSILCDVCCQVFESHQALKSHDSVSLPSTCPICSLSSKDDENLTSHIVNDEDDEL